MRHLNEFIAKAFKEEEKKYLEKMKEKIMQDLVEATPVDTGFAASNWKITPTGIENDTPYLEQLNAGSSEQAPAHFVEQTILAQKGVRPNGPLLR